MKISVIMSVYNEKERYLRKAIESILNQTFKDFEFIIILDNPNNKVLEKIILDYSKKDSRIKFIKNNKNLGLASSLNKGIKLAKGTYIIRMDADDISIKNRLKIQYEFMKKNSKVDLSFCWTKLIDEKDNLIKTFLPSKKYCLNLNKSFFKKELFSHPTLIIKSRILKKLKYDSSLKYSQDHDLWLRCISKNLKFSIIEEFLLNYRIESQNYKKRVDKYIIGLKYLLKTYLKNFKYFKYNIYFLKKFMLILTKYLFLKIIPKKLLYYYVKRR